MHATLESMAMHHANHVDLHVPQMFRGRYILLHKGTGESRWRSGGFGAQTLTQLARSEVRRRKCLEESLKKKQ